MVDNPNSNPEGVTSSDAMREKSKKAAKYLDNGGSDKSKYVLFGVVALFVVVIVGGAVLFTTQGSNSVNVSGANYPNGVTAENPGWSSNADQLTEPNAGTVSIFEDFQCPGCEVFESNYGTFVKNFANENNLNLVYYPMSFLDTNLGNDSSAQASNAFACAINAGVGSEYHDVLFLNHPTPEGTGWTVQQLKGYGEDVGLTGQQLKDFESCVDSGTYLGWSRSVNVFAADQGVNATPTVLVNGEPVDQDSFATSELLGAKILELAQANPQ